MIRDIQRRLREAFGDPIGSYAGDAPVGVRSVEEAEVCSECGMMYVEGDCGCKGVNESAMDEDICAECGMMYVEGEGCGCTHLEETKKKGPSKKTAQKILRGTKTFKEKMKKVSSWAEDPAAAAAWMTKKATGKWPSQE